MYQEKIQKMQQMMQQMMNNNNNTNIGSGNMQNCFDPTRMDISYKRQIISHNISQAKGGHFKQIPKFNSIRVPYSQNYDPGSPSKICEVLVIYDHAIDVAKQFAEVGCRNFTNDNNKNPVIINTVGEDFTGLNFESNEEIRDEIVNLRTTISVTTGNNPPYPLKNGDCVYTKLVSVIRPKIPTSLLNWENLYRIGIITGIINNKRR
jgi:hypothetical protein